MSKITSVLAFFLISLIWLFSFPLPSSAQVQPAVTSVPNSGVEVHAEVRFLSFVQPQKLKMFMRNQKGSRGRGFGTGSATRAHGRTSSGSAYRTNQPSSVHFGSVFASSLFSGFVSSLLMQLFQCRKDL